LEAKLRDFEAEGKLKGLIARQQLQEKQDALKANYNQARQMVANQNIAAVAEKENQERANKNLINRNANDILN